MPSGPDGFVLMLRHPATSAEIPVQVTFLADADGQIRYFRTQTAVGIRAPS